MTDEELITINVWLIGRSYRIKIKPEEEEAVRKSVKIADEKVKEMRNQYSGKDDQDFLAMVLLMYAADNAIDSFHNPFFQNELKSVIGKIENALNEDN